MDTSLLIAKLIAPIYIMAALGMLINPSYYSKLIEDMIKNSAIVYLGGLMAAVAGLLMVTYHNIWESSWVVVITIFGWLALVKGLFFLVFPMKVVVIKSFYKKENIRLMAVFALIIGGFFAYFGYLA